MSSCLHSKPYRDQAISPLPVHLDYQFHWIKTLRELGEHNPGTDCEGVSTDEPTEGFRVEADDLKVLEHWKAGSSWRRGHWELHAFEGHTLSSLFLYSPASRLL